VVREPRKQPIVGFEVASVNAARHHVLILVARNAGVSESACAASAATTGGTNTPDCQIGHLNRSLGGSVRLYGPGKPGAFVCLRLPTGGRAATVGYNLLASGPFPIRSP
jgi:hypothetical protein